MVADVRDGLLHGGVAGRRAGVGGRRPRACGHVPDRGARLWASTTPPFRLLPLALLALLAMGLPSVAGWGPREGAAAWTFAVAGLGAGAASAAVAYGALVLVASLPGRPVLVAGVAPTRRCRRRAAHGGPPVRGRAAHA